MFDVFVLILAGISISALFLYVILYRDQLKKNTNLHKRIDASKIDFKYASEAMLFLDNLIQVKYDYHLYSTIMPIYLDKKIPEKKEIEQIKERIYVSIVGGLSPTTKKSILLFFNEKGIEIYIHEKIINLMNKTDFINSEKFKESFRDIKGDGINTLIP